MASVIVCGATGAVGREFVRECVQADDGAIANVTALTRRHISVDDSQALLAAFPGIDVERAQRGGKLRVVASFDWESFCKDPTDAGLWQGVFAGHHFAVCALGTTRKDAGSAQAFRHVDFEFVTAFATAVAHFSGSTTATTTTTTTSSSSLRHFIQVSSVGAKSSSWLLYFKTKGLADDFVSSLEAFPIVSIYRPGMLNRKEKARFGEKLFSWCMTAMPVETVGRAMLNELLGGVSPSFAKQMTEGKEEQQGAKTSSRDVRVYSNAHITELSKL